MGGPNPRRPEPAAELPEGRRYYRVAQAYHVSATWVRAGDVIALLDGDQVEDLIARWEPLAQRAEHGRVILQEIAGDYRPDLRQRLVPILPTSTTGIVPYRRGTFPSAD